MTVSQLLESPVSSTTDGAAAQLAAISELLEAPTEASAVSTLFKSSLLSSKNESIFNLQNAVSGGTAGVYISKGAIGGHQPYVLETLEDATIIVHNFHFLAEVRRQLAGVVTTDTCFSTPEQTHYDNYLAYADGTTFIDDELLLVQALDFWLVEEVQGHEHPTITRDYSKETHPWRNFGQEI